MIIILEGHEGSGKSTLAERLRQQTGYPVVHRSQPKTQEEKDTMMERYMQDIRTGKNVIYDRCWYSEMVYGPTMRDASYITYPQMYEIESLLAKKGAMLIYCTDDVVTLWNRARARGEEYITDRETFIKIYNQYEEVMSVPHLIPVVKYQVPKW